MALEDTKSGKLLLKAFLAGQVEEIRWKEIILDDLAITVATDALKTAIGEHKGVRLPVSYLEAVCICQELDCISPTKEICDAMYAQADHKLVYVGLVRTSLDATLMDTIGFSLRFNKAIEKQLGDSFDGLLFGAWKLWILHSRIVERGAINYGFWDIFGHTIQTVGGMHNPLHYDYSQLLQPIKRVARMLSTGEEVDLIHYFLKNGIPERYLTPYTSRDKNLGG